MSVNQRTKYLFNTKNKRVYLFLYLAPFKLEYIDE